MKKISYKEFLKRSRERYPDLKIRVRKEDYCNTMTNVKIKVNGVNFEVSPLHLMKGTYKFLKLGLYKQERSLTPGEILERIINKTKEKHPDIKFSLKMNEKTLKNTKASCEFLFNGKKLVDVPYNLMSYGLSLKTLGIKKKGLVKTSAEELLSMIQNGWDNNGTLVPARPFISFNVKDYKAIKQPLKFIDSEYGEWIAIPRNILLGANHWDRSKLKLSEDMRMGAEVFQNKLHTGYINYRKQEVPPRPYLTIKEGTFLDTKNKCTFIDADHGEFTCRASDVLMGREHPKRSRAKSRYEYEIESWVESLGIPCVRNKKFRYNGKTKEADVFIESHQVGIDYHGLYWHSELRRDKKNHFNKRKFFNEQNIFIFQILEDEWRFKADIVKSMIAKKLNIANQIINANDPDCQIKFVSKEEATKFLQENNLKGTTNKSVQHLGLYHVNMLVAMISYKINKTRLEIHRLTEANDTIVTNAYKKLESILKKQYPQIKEIKVILDLRFEDPKSYTRNKFQKNKETLSYRLTDMTQSYDKHDPEASLAYNRSEQDENNEPLYQKIYDAGQGLYIKKI